MQAVELANLDEFDDSDPFCSVFTRIDPDKPWIHLGKTETVDNNLNPKWVKHFAVNY